MCATTALRSASSLTLKAAVVQPKATRETRWLPRFHYANDCVSAAQRFTSVGLVIVGNAIAVIAAARRRVMNSGVQQIVDISRVWKDDWIIGIVSSVTGDGEVTQKKA